MQKIYVLDTNVLLHDPIAIQAFHEHKVIIPMTVLEELDAIKDRKQKDVSREARIAISGIDKLLTDATPKEIQAGVKIFPDRNGTLAIFPDQMISDAVSAKFLDASPQQNNDNRIINVALTLQADNPKAFVCLVTKDINMRIKAKGCGLANVEDYRRDKVLDDIDLLFQGHIRYAGSFWDKIDSVETIKSGVKVMHHINSDLLPNIYPNMFIRDDEDFVGYVESIADKMLNIRDLSGDQLMRQNF